MTTDLVQSTFDYSVLPTETALELRMSAERVRMRLKRTVEDIVAIGQELQVSQERLAKAGSGKFLEWIDAEFEMSQRTAYNFIGVFDRFGSDFATVAKISPKVLYQLAAPSTPESVVQAVLSGEIPATTDAIKAAKEAERQANEKSKHLQEQLFEREKERQEAQKRITQLTQAIDEMDEQVRALRNAPAPEPIIKETIKEVVPESVKRELAEKEQQLAALRLEHKKLAEHAYELQKQAEAETQKHFSGENARRIRLKWYSTRNAFATAARKLIADLPLPADTEQFDADDWQGLAELRAMVERIGDELRMLHEPNAYIIEG
jgi:uncharacterized protein YaaR (DUF327 family)